MLEKSKCIISLLLCAGLVAGLGACSTLEKHIPGIGTLTSDTNGSVAAEGVYYSGTPDLPLYRSPGGVIVKRLPQYTKLHRDGLDRGFAHVRVDSTGESGWVENAKLVWRRPKPGSSEQAHEAASQPAAELSAPQAVEPPPSPQAAEPPEPPVSPPQAIEPSPSPLITPAPGTVAPSIFNPY